MAEEGNVGEVSLQVDLFTQPGTGEHKITVKGKLISSIIIYDETSTAVLNNIIAILRKLCLVRRLDQSIFYLYLYPIQRKLGGKQVS